MRDKNAGGGSSGRTGAGKTSRHDDLALNPETLSDLTSEGVGETDTLGPADPTDTGQVVDDSGGAPPDADRPR